MAKCFSIIAICLTSIVLCVSCNDENVGEYKLSGNIEKLIPESSYYIKSTINNDRIVFTPILSRQFAYWGITLKKVEYYIDGILCESEAGIQNELIVNEDEIAAGEHELEVRLTVGAENCDDVILVSKEKFHTYAENVIGKKVECYLDYDYVTVGEIITITPELLKKQDSENYEIDKVAYYWDGTFLKSQNIAPYVLEHRIEDSEMHSLQATVYFHSTKNGAVYTCQYSQMDRWGYGDNDGIITWNLKSIENEYKNNETLNLIAKQFKGKNVQDNYSLDFYLDDELIGHTTTFPYTLSYKLKDIKIGKHTVMCVQKKEGSSVEKSSCKQIIITE